MNYKLLFLGIVVILLGAGIFFFFSQHATTPLNTAELPLVKEESRAPTHYLAFQIFTPIPDDPTMNRNIPSLAKSTIADSVDDIIRAIGTVGGKDRKLGFIPGPLSFDHTDDQIRTLMRDSFSVALEKNIAVGFHVDDSMFWGQLSYLNKIENIEWLDWNKTPNTGRRLDWSSTPTKIMPQLCLNSPTVKAGVKKRASLIAEEVKRGMETLKAANKKHLFLGIIADWEPRIGVDFDTGKNLGYCALTNQGYSAKNPPADIDEARVDIVKEFIDFWAKSLADGGVPDKKIFSHTAFIPKVAFDLAQFGNPDKKLPGSYLEMVNFTPSRVSFGEHHYAGFSTYPQFGLLEEIRDELAKRDNPPWASTEGTAIDPAQAEKGRAGVPMETYLGNMFNHGAVLVNIFGWGVGPSSNPFRKIAESGDAVTAYRKFLRGEKLQEETPVQIPSPQFFSQGRRLQKELPVYLKEHGPEKVGVLYTTLGEQMNAQRYTDAEKTIDEILKIIAK